MNVPKLTPRKKLLALIALIFSLAAITVVAFFMRPAPAAPIDSYAKCAEAGYPILLTYPSACKYRNHTFVEPNPTPIPSPVSAVSIPYQLLVQGNSGGAYPTKQELITTQAAWTQYWNEVHNGLSSTPPILPVDFKTSHVVAASMGQRSTGGYSLKITGILQSPAGTTVSLTQSTPGAGCMVTQAITNPYLIVQTQTLTQPVNFRITEEKRPC